MKLVLFSGGNPSGILNDTWLWDGSNWTLVGISTSNPENRFGHAMATQAEQLVLFGGSGYNGRLNDTWVWDGASWTVKFPTISPPPRAYHAMATFGATVVVFGGYDASGNSLSDTELDDEFTFN